MDAFVALMRFLDQLAKRRISYRLARVRPDALMVELALPGERWEIEFTASGAVEAERFRSDGEIGDQAVVDALLREFDAVEGDGT